MPYFAPALVISQANQFVPSDLLELSGIAMFATSGAPVAARKGMNIFGIVVVARRGARPSAAARSLQPGQGPRHPL